jgi:hypothetical protein
MPGSGMDPIFAVTEDGRLAYATVENGALVVGVVPHSEGLLAEGLLAADEGVYAALRATFFLF